MSLFKKILGLGETDEASRIINSYDHDLSDEEEKAIRYYLSKPEILREFKLHYEEWEAPDTDLVEKELLKFQKYSVNTRT